MFKHISIHLPDCYLAEDMPEFGIVWLSKLRRSKKSRPGDFNKPLPKAQLKAIADTPYAAMAVYYKVSDGAFLSNEYELFFYAGAQKANEKLQADLTREELL